MNNFIRLVLPFMETQHCTGAAHRSPVLNVESRAFCAVNLIVCLEGRPSSPTTLSSKTFVACIFPVCTVKPEPPAPPPPFPPPPPP